VKNGSKANSNIGNVMNDSENDEDGKNIIQNIQPKNLFGEKKDVTSNRVETRATRSQTRAEENFKQLNDSQLSDGKKDQETLREQSGESQLTEDHSIEDELIDIDQIEIEPLPSDQDVMLNQTVCKTTRSSTQRHRSLDNLSTTRVNTKKISNQMLEEISANFVSNSSIKNIASEYKNVMVGQSRIENANITGCLIPIDSSSVVKDTIILRKEGGQSFENTANALSALDDKLLRQHRILDLKETNIKCIDSISDPTILSFKTQPIVVVNKIKTPFNIKLSELSLEEIQAKNDPKRMIRINNSSKNFVQLLDDGDCSFPEEVLIIDDDDDDVNINVDNSTLTKTEELSSNVKTQDLSSKVANVNNSSTLSDNSKSTDTQLGEEKLNDKIPWNMFGKTKNILNVPLKISSNQLTISKIGNISTIKETNNRFIKELDFDFDQSISQTSLSELYNGVEEIVEMHSFDNEELNSLIECGSSGNETGVRKNPVSLDQGDSSVSESDSTIGAFDTFAQITGVPQKISSKEIKSASKDLTAVKKAGKDLERDESFIQSDEIDDDSCSIVSVTGIPVLQGVISDVMSKIDSDRVAALNAVDLPKAHVTDIVEISSDEDVEILDDDDEFSDGEKDPLRTSINKFNDIKLKANISKINHETAKDAINIIKQIEKSISNRNKLITVNKSDTERVQSVHVVRKSDTIKTHEMENIQSRKEIELEVNKNAEVELKVVGDNVDRFLPFNKIQENKLKEAEIKKAKEIELKIISEEKFQCENTLNNVRDTKEKLPGKAEEKKKNEDEEMKVKEVEEKEFESETMKRFQETEIEKELKTNEINKVIDFKKAKESEIQIIKEAELLKIAREEEAIRVGENCELEIRKTKEAEIQRVKEAELQTAKEVEIQKAKEAEAQKVKEEEMRIVKEAESKKAREAELIEAKATEIRRAKEAEIRKIKEDELRKAIEIEQKNVLEVEMKEKEINARVREAEFKEMEEIEINEVEKNKKAAREMETSKLIKDEKTKLNNIEEPKEDLIPLKKSKKTANERLMLEPKKTNVREIGKKESEVEGSKLKEQEPKKVVENEEKKGQEIEIKIFTRTRGLKPEEKCDDDCIVVSKNVFINSSSSIKSLEQSSSSASLTNVESPSTSFIHDSSKQIKHPDCVNTRKTSDTNLKELCDKNSSDSNENSSENVKKELSQLVRTRSSSSLKQCQQLEIKLTPYYSSYNVGPTSKTTRETKTRVSTPTNSNLQSNLETLKMESSAKALFDGKCGKQLTVSVVMLSANEVTIHKEKGDQRSDNNSVKQFENKV